jgi:Asp-tRNA(Asn)/Glu-tRNA(Gln) amidotransferase A subunit family amidase
VTPPTGAGPLDRTVALERAAGVDVLVCPTVALPAPAIDGPDETVRLNRNTKPFNGPGWPAITLPCGLDDLGLAVGLQLVGMPAADEALLSIAASVEAALGEEHP